MAAGPKLPTLSQALGNHGGPKLPSAGSLPSLGDVLGGHHAAPKPVKPRSGGFWHELGHIASQTGTDLYNTAIHSPAGLYETGKAVAEASGGDYQPLEKIGKATVEGVVQDVKHPLRHPGNTALDIGAVLSLGAGTAARVAEVGRVAEEGGAIGDVLKAAAKGPKPEARTIRYGDTDVQAGVYSRSALKRSTQKLFDKFQQRFPDLHLPVRNLHERVGHELAQNRKVQDQAGRSPAHELATVKLGNDRLAKQKALQVAAEGVPAADRIAFHEKRLAEYANAGKTRLAAATRKEIALLHGAQKYLDDTGGVPRIAKDQPELVKVFDKARQVAQEREQMLYGTDRLARVGDKVDHVAALTDEAAAGRLTKPGEVLGHTFDPGHVPELFRFPYVAKQPKGALFGMAGYKGGIPRTPGSLNHEFVGGLLKSGAFRNDTTRLVAESYLEAHRFAALMKHRDQFLSMAHDEPMSAHDIPIRTDPLLNRQWPKVLDDLADSPELSKGDLETLGKYYENVRGNVFPPKEQTLADLHSLEPGAHPDVKWIDKRLLGGLNEPNPLVGFTGKARAGLHVFDAINNASRAAILYLKPAYAVPNILGNAALNLVHMGWASPAHLVLNTRLWWKLDGESRAAILTAAGEGVTGSLHTVEGPMSRSINWMARQWQKPVDTPFRINAMMEEARRFGYTTPAKVKELLGNEDELTRVAREANAAIIDYGNLGPFEQNVVRRVVFFYPWVKGSSQYAARFLTTHHVQAAVLGQMGRQGYQKDLADLGVLPSYADGEFKVGERDGNPLVLNPSSAGILQTPAQLLQTVRELADKHPGEAFQFSQNFTPAVQAALALLARQGVRNNQSALQGAEQVLIGGLPAVTTGQGLLHPPAGSSKPRVYPRTRRDVILHFLGGGLAPSPINLGKAHQAAYAEKHPH